MPLLVALLALAFAMALRASSLAAWGLVCALAWAAVELALRTRVGPHVRALAEGPRARLLALALLLALASAWGLGPRVDALVAHEGLAELVPRTLDRLRLAPPVAIAPPLVTNEAPQSFFVRAPGAGAVSVRFGGVDAEVSALGHGVFRVELEPRGTPLAQRSSGTIGVTVTVDGAHHARELAFVAPLAHPRAPHLAGSQLCAVSEETDALFVAGAGGPLRTVAALDGPTACMTHGGRVWVAHRHDPHLGVLEGVLEGEQVRAVLDVGVGAIAMVADDTTLVVARHAEVAELVLVDLPTLTVRARVPLEGEPLSLARVGEELALTTRAPAQLEVRSLSEGARLRHRALSMPAAALAVHDDEVVIATTAFDAAAQPNLGNHFVEDQLVWLERATLRPTRIEPTARRTARQDHAGDVDRGLSPSSLAFDDAGRLWVAFAGSSELGVYERGVPTRLLPLEAHLFGPSGVAVGADRVVVTSAIDGVVLELSARALETSAVEASAVEASDVEASAITRVAPSPRELLADQPHMLRVRLGERTFWEGTRAGASCQSCHLRGSSDAVAHNIGGRVLAPTLDVRGLAGTAPFLRDGSYPRLGDLHEVARLEYRGYRAPAGDRRSTLEAYLESLPLPRSFAPRDVVREQRGLAAFVRAGCEGCHAPPAFTTLARYPLHTVFPGARGEPSLSLDVPSLRNLRGQAPYLYDGRAARLEDVLGAANEANAHGDTAALSPAERADLVFFLETL